jgi:DNA topoisomerase-2
MTSPTCMLPPGTSSPGSTHSLASCFPRRTSKCWRTEKKKALPSSPCTLCPPPFPLLDLILETILDSSRALATPSPCVRMWGGVQVPVLPMLLVNGATGIGTGFSCSVPSFGVPDLIACARAYIHGEELPSLVAHFEGFHGSVEMSEKNVITRGVIVKTGPRSATITELPVGRWTEPFLTELKAVASGAKKIKGLSLITILNLSTEFKVNIELQLGEENEKDSAESLAEILRLRTTFPMTYMFAFDRNYQLRLFKTPHDIVREHAGARLELYEIRKMSLLKELKVRIALLSSRSRFIGLVCSAALPLQGSTKAALATAMRAHGLEELSAKTGEDPSYDYLFSLSVASFTKEKIEALQAEAATMQSELDILGAKSAKDLWTDELACVEVAHADYQKRVRERHADDADNIAPSRIAAAAQRPKAKAFAAASTASKRQRKL